MKSYMIPYVVEQTGRGERTYDIYSRLLLDRKSSLFRIIFFDRLNNFCHSSIDRIREYKSVLFCSKEELLKNSVDCLDRADF